MSLRLRTILLYSCSIAGLFILSNCSSRSSTDPPNPFQNYNPQNSNRTEENKLKVSLKKQEDRINEMSELIEDQNKKIDSQDNLIQNLSNELKDEINFMRSSQQNLPEIDIMGTLIKLKNKSKILEDRAFYTDSLYFEIVNDLVQMENKILSLNTSYIEMVSLKNGDNTEKLPPISDEEFTAQYIESLSAYQIGEWAKSLEGFKYLIAVNRTHDLADNCQYWIGEVFYAQKDYQQCIKEFEIVFSFPGTNKADDAQYKLGISYMNIGNKGKAISEFTKLIEYYPNSEYYKKTSNYLNQLQ